MGDILLVFKAAQVVRYRIRKRCNNNSNKQAKYSQNKLCTNTFYNHNFIVMLNRIPTGDEREKNWSKTTDESRQYRQVFTAKYTHSVRCSSCLQEIVFCGYVTVIQYISVLCVCMCTIYTDLGRSKQSFFTLLAWIPCCCCCLYFFRSLCSVKPEIYFTSRVNHKNMVVLKAPTKYRAKHPLAHTQTHSHRIGLLSTLNIFDVTVIYCGLK